MYECMRFSPPTSGVRADNGQYFVSLARPSLHSADLHLARIRSTAGLSRTSAFSEILGNSARGHVTFRYCCTCWAYQARRTDHDRWGIPIAIRLIFLPLP